MVVGNLSAIDPVNQLAISYQSIIGIAKITIGGLFGLAFLSFFARLFQEMRIIHHLKVIREEIEDLQERFDTLEAKQNGDEGSDDDSEDEE